MSKLPEVSEKNKKNEIFDAYHAALEKLKEKESPKIREQIKRVEEEKTVTLSQTLSSDSIIKNLAETKSCLGKALDQLESSLLERYREFANLCKAIEIQKSELETLHQISVEADSLTAFVHAHRETKQRLEEEIEKRRLDLEEEITERKALWEKEKKAYEYARKEEEEERLRTEKKRQEEEYHYQLKTSRQKEEDVYKEKRKSLERELSEMKAKAEQELAERDKQIASKECGGPHCLDN